jgi:hypothetical protein
VTRDDELTLAYLVGRAWERRAEPDFRERVAAIIDWFDRRDVRAFERRQRSRAAVLQCLRETAPAPGKTLRAGMPQASGSREWTGDELGPPDWHG